MERYKVMSELGDGTCGTVYKALNETNEIVPVKKMKRKFYFWEECMNLREVKSLRKLNHPNIVKLREIVQENHELFFIFEYMSGCHYYLLIKVEMKKAIKSSLPSSYMANSQVTCPTVGFRESTGFSVATLHPNLRERQRLTFSPLHY